MERRSRNKSRSLSTRASNSGKLTRVEFGLVRSILISPSFASFGCEKTVNFSAQDSDLNGLGDVTIHSGGHEPLSVPGHGMRGHSYDRSALTALLPRANRVGRIQAAEHWHLDVHQNEVE